MNFFNNIYHAEDQPTYIKHKQDYYGTALNLWLNRFSWGPGKYNLVLPSFVALSSGCRQTNGRYQVHYIILLFAVDNYINMIIWIHYFYDRP